MLLTLTQIVPSYNAMCAVCVCVIVCVCVCVIVYVYMCTRANLNSILNRAQLGSTFTRALFACLPHLPRMSGYPWRARTFYLCTKTIPVPKPQTVPILGIEFEEGIIKININIIIIRVRRRELSKRKNSFIEAQRA